jgi:hypothetical protein
MQAIKKLVTSIQNSLSSANTVSNPQYYLNTPNQFSGNGALGGGITTTTTTTTGGQYPLIYVNPPSYYNTPVSIPVTMPNYLSEQFLLKVAGKIDYYTPSFELKENVDLSGNIERVLILDNETSSSDWGSKFEIGEKIDQIHILESKESNKNVYLYSLNDCIVSSISLVEKKINPMTVYIASIQPGRKVQTGRKVQIRYNNRECNEKLKEWYKVAG